MTNKNNPHKANATRASKTPAKSTVCFGRICRQLGQVRGCSEQAVTGATTPESSHGLCRSFTPDERMFASMAAVANLNVAQTQGAR